MIFVQVLLTTLGVLLILLLVLPFEITGQGEWGIKKVYQIRITWAGSLLSFNLEAQQGLSYPVLTIFGVTLWRGSGKSGDKPKKSRQEKKKEAKQNKQGFSLRKAKRMLTDRDLISTSKSFLGNMIKVSGLEFKAWGTYYTDDPALTGIIAGFLAAINKDKIILDLEPDFSDDNLDIKARISGRFMIVKVIAISLTFLWQKPVRYYWLSAIKAKFRFKEVAHHV
jgi:hypothetical protein